MLNKIETIAQKKGVPLTIIARNSKITAPDLIAVIRNEMGPTLEQGLLIAKCLGCRVETVFPIDLPDPSIEFKTGSAQSIQDRKKDRIQELKKCAESGFDIEQTADQMGLSINTIKSYAYAHQIKFTRKKKPGRSHFRLSSL